MVKTIIRPQAKQRTRCPEILLERQEAITGVKYFVKWTGFHDKENSWEHESDLPKALVAKFIAGLQAVKAVKALRGTTNAAGEAVDSAEDDDGTEEDEADAGMEGEDSYCDMCKGGDSLEGNAIVLCDGCDSAYHQDCHAPNGISEEELDSEDLWFCSNPGCQAQLVILKEEEARGETAEQGVAQDGDGPENEGDWGSVETEVVEEAVKSGEASLEKTINPLFSQQVTASPTQSEVNPMLKRLEEAEKKQLERQKHRKATTGGSGRLQGMKRAMKRGSKPKRGRPLGK